LSLSVVLFSFRIDTPAGKPLPARAEMSERASGGTFEMRKETLCLSLHSS